MAKSSPEGWGEWPRVCIWCGAKLQITKEPLWFHCENGQRWTAHPSCIKEHGLPDLT